MNATGKAARKRHGTRFAAKAAKTRKANRKKFGKLPVSVSRGNNLQFIHDQGAMDGNRTPKVDAE